MTKEYYPEQSTNSIKSLSSKKLYFSQKKNSTFSLEAQKTLNSNSNLEKGNQIWRNKPSILQNILKNYSNQDNIVLEQKQKHRSMK